MHSILKWGSRGYTFMFYIWSLLDMHKDVFNNKNGWNVGHEPYINCNFGQSFHLAITPWCRDWVQTFPQFHQVAVSRQHFPPASVPLFQWEMIWRGQPRLVWSWRLGNMQPHLLWYMSGNLFELLSPNFPCYGVYIEIVCYLWLQGHFK